jgi:hypothetical protein
VCVLPDVFATYNDVTADRLLEAGVEFVAIAGRICRGDTRDQISNDLVLAPRARKHQVFVKGSFHESRIGSAKNGTASLEGVSYAETRLRLTRNRKTIVKVAAYAEIEGPVALGDQVLDVEGEFLYIRMAVK